MGMSMITDTYILIKLSNSLSSFIKELNPEENMPLSLKNIILNKTNKCNDVSDSDSFVPLASSDYKKLKSIEEKYGIDDSTFKFTETEKVETFSSDDKNSSCLRVQDLTWLYQKLDGQNVYIHELLQNSITFVPENKKIERNPELEKRCVKLKIQHENKLYKIMTKHIDKIHYADETIGSQSMYYCKIILYNILYSYYSFYIIPIPRFTR